MTGPNPPGRKTEESDSASELSREPDSGGDAGDESEAHDEVREISPYDALDPLDDSAEIARAAQTGQPDAYSRAYSAPEVEHFSSGPYVPADPRLYDYDAYNESADSGDEHAAPRWPWVIGVAAIVAAIALVVSVSLLVARTDTNKLANPDTTITTRPAPPMQDEITTTTPPPPPPTEIPTATETQTVTVTPVPPPPAPAPAPPPATTTVPPSPTTTAPAGPRQVTYSVTGTKAPGDIITVTYVDSAGRRRTQHNVYIPWSMTVTPISQSDVGQVEASSLFRVSRLNCSITTSDGAVLSSSATDAPQTSC